MAWRALGARFGVCESEGAKRLRERGEALDEEFPLGEAFGGTLARTRTAAREALETLTLDLSGMDEETGFSTTTIHDARTYSHMRSEHGKGPIPPLVDDCFEDDLSTRGLDSAASTVSLASGEALTTASFGGDMEDFLSTGDSLLSSMGDTAAATERVVHERLPSPNPTDEALFAQFDPLRDRPSGSTARGEYHHPDLTVDAHPATPTRVIGAEEATPDLELGAAPAVPIATYGAQRAGTIPVTIDGVTFTLDLSITRNGKTNRANLTDQDIARYQKLIQEAWTKLKEEKGGDVSIKDFQYLNFSFDLLDDKDEINPEGDFRVEYRGEHDRTPIEFYSNPFKTMQGKNSEAYAKITLLAQSFKTHDFTIPNPVERSSRRSHEDARATPESDRAAHRDEPARSQPQSYTGIAGLPNAGTDCFFNSAMQLMSHAMPDLSADVKEHGTTHPIDDGTLASSQLEAVDSILTKLQDDERAEGTRISTATTHDIRNFFAFRATGGQADDGTAQQDPAELFGYVMDAVPDGERTTRIPIVTSRTDTVSAERHVDGTDTVYPKTTLRLSPQGSDSTEIDFMTRFNAGFITPQTELSIEHLDNGGIITYEGRQFAATPDRFMVHVQRNTGEGGKITNPLSTPTEITLQKGTHFTAAVTQDQKYRVKGAIIHTGTAAAGHYITVCEIDGKFYEFSDSNVTQLSRAEFERQIKQASILMYEKGSMPVTEAPAPRGRRAAVPALGTFSSIDEYERHLISQSSLKGQTPTQIIQRLNPSARDIRDSFDICKQFLLNKIIDYGDTQADSQGIFIGSQFENAFGVIWINTKDPKKDEALRILKDQYSDIWDQITFRKDNSSIRFANTEIGQIIQKGIAESNPRYEQFMRDLLLFHIINAQTPAASAERLPAATTSATLETATVTKDTAITATRDAVAANAPGVVSGDIFTFTKTAQTSGRKIAVVNPANAFNRAGQLEGQMCTQITGLAASLDAARTTHSGAEGYLAGATCLVTKDATLEGKNLDVLSVAALDISVHRGETPSGQFTPAEITATEEKVEALLIAAVNGNYDEVFIPALGCGVFKNPANEIADIFKRKLNDPRFKNKVKVTFVTYPPRSSTTPDIILQAFQAQFTATRA